MDERCVGDLRAAVDALLAVDLDAIASDEFVAVLEAVEVQRRRLDAVDARLLANAAERHVAANHCRASTADLLVHQLRLSRGEANARVRRACDLGPRRSLLGESLEPIHPVLAAAQRSGQISGQQIDVALKALGRLPSDIACEASGPVEQYLATAAAHEGPAELARSAELILHRLDPDGAEPNDERTHANRDFHLRRNSNGSWTPSGSLTDETGLVWQTLLDALSAPAPAQDGVRDPRTPGERQHDALRDLGIQILRSGTVHDAGGTPVTITVRTSVDDIAEPGGNGRCQTGHGHVMRLGALVWLAGDAALVPVLFDRAESDRQLYLGRTRRLANRAQRRMLGDRDGGCCFPGCDRPASWCEVHHIVEWVCGGPTDLDNLCLLCPFHHREFGRSGWAVLMSDGRPSWVPPAWLDPDRRPRVNRSHHLPNIVFEPGGALVAERP